MRHANILLTLFIIVFATTLYAQKADTITVNTITKKITIGNHIILSTTTIEQVKKMLGLPDRVEKLAGRERVFAYDRLGISFEIGRDTVVRTLTSLSITYNFDGDKKVSKHPFIGTLYIDTYLVTKTTNASDITANTAVKLNCLGNVMCVTDPNYKGMGVMLSFLKDVKELVAIGFRIN